MSVHNKVYSFKQSNMRGLTIEILRHRFMNVMQHMETAGLDKQVYPSIRLSISVTDENDIQSTTIKYDNILYNKR